jgi:biopolymer transport protein TolR
LKDGTTAPVRVSRDELITRILDRQAKNPDQAVVIAADGAVRYDDVMHVLDLLQQKGVHKVGLLLRPQQS